eukprot:scaffold659_cov314-Alexandrium_tamarense.AAC.2
MRTYSGEFSSNVSLKAPTCLRFTGQSLTLSSPSCILPTTYSDSPTDTPIIRHAGYLLKRSNFPYMTIPSTTTTTCTNSSVPSSTGNNEIIPPSIENVISGLAPLPDLNDHESSSGHNGVFMLPFGGDDNVIEVTTAGNVVGKSGLDAAILTLGGQNVDANLFLGEVMVSSAPVVGDAGFLPVEAESVVVHRDSAAAATTTAAAAAAAQETPCFCSPVIQLFDKLFGKSRPSNAIVSEIDTGTTIRTSNQTNLPISPRPTRPLPNVQTSDTTIKYNMPLKAPARTSLPVPISPPPIKKSASQPRRIGSSSQLLSRSMSNGSKMNLVSTAAVATTKTMEHNKPERKLYPPPPADYVDPKDGHIWRAKYCVLEDGILYFYRNAEEGESDEAAAERNESRMLQSFDSESNFQEVAGVMSSSPKGATSSTTTGAVPIPFSKMSVSGNGRMSSRESLRKPSSHDLHDLSKSPMPLKKSDIFVFAKSPSHRSTSNVSSGVPPPLHHSLSTNTFNHDADILWEKRVGLDCVGAVRSSEQEHGNHAFELLAFGMDDRVTGDDISDASTHTGSLGGQIQQHEIVDRLVLRAGGSDDMNDWMFQFHRSLSSYMLRLVNSVRKGDGMHHYQDSPIHHRLLPTPILGGKGTSLSPFITRQASSPTTNSFGGSHSPNIAASLSHGHGRNAVYRRKVRDNKRDDVCISPVSTPGGTPGGGSSPIDGARPFVPSLPKSTIVKVQNKISISPREVVKYIPPHKRKQGGSSIGKAMPPLEPEDNATNATESKPQAGSEIGGSYEQPIADERDATEPVDESLSESVMSTSSSLLSRQMEESDDMSSADHHVRLGGCADPKVIVGSISDHHFIPRKASVVGNARLDAYGGFGGGLFTSPKSIDSMQLDDIAKSSGTNTLVLKWEIGAASECGIRNANEDAYVAINNLDAVIKKQGFVSFADQDFGETKQQGVYGIFDGHVGNQAARFSAEEFPNFLIEEQSKLASIDSACVTSIQERTNTILLDAFERLDREFCRLCTRDGRDWDCGSTALVALIVDDVVTLANLGDCRGVVCRMISSDDVDVEGWENLNPDEDTGDKWDRANGGDDYARGKLFWKEITEPHSPLLPEERARIENANGWIIKETEIPTGQIHRMDFFDKDVLEIVKRCMADRFKQHRSDPIRQIQIARTCGDLAVSRAVGDRDFKAAYNSPDVVVEERTELAISWEGPPVFIYPEGHSGRFKGDLVSSVPDITFVKVGQEGVEAEFLLMACDGLWDVMDGDDAVRIAKDLLFDKKMSAKDGAARLAELAKHLGSSDNITVILIRFYWAVGKEP